MTDVRQWARETAPTLTDEEWNDTVIKVAVCDGARQRPGFGPPRGRVASWTAGQVRALFAHLREVAEGLRPEQVAEYFETPSGKAYSVDALGFGQECSAFGRAVFRYLERQR